MSAYDSFALYYDRLMQHAGYPERAAYLLSVFSYLRHAPGLTLDLACGTGRMTLALAQQGLDIYGVDSSSSMLSIAQQRASDAGLSILFLQQQMQRLDLYGTVDTVLCTFDSINHLTREADVQKTFARVSLFLNPGGYFIFDLNTIYKHRHILENHTFVYDLEDLYCVWQNHLNSETNRVAIALDFFAREGAVYHRSSTRFYERAYSISQMEHWLSLAGLQLCHIFADMTFSPPEDDTERILVIARKPQ